MPKLTIPQRQPNQDDATYAKIVQNSIREQRPYLSDDDILSLAQVKISTMPSVQPSSQPKAQAAPKVEVAKVEAPQAVRASTEVVSKAVPKQVVATKTLAEAAREFGSKKAVTDPMESGIVARQETIKKLPEQPAIMPSLGDPKVAAKVAKMYETFVGSPKQPQAPVELTGRDFAVEEQKGYGYRNDGTQKGRGYLGELKMKDGSGNIATEMSIGVNIDGKEMEIPTITPNLTQDEIDYLLKGNNVLDRSEKSERIIEKSIAFAKDRIKKGLSPFYEPIKQTQPTQVSEQQISQSLKPQKGITIGGQAEDIRQQLLSKKASPLETIQNPFAAPKKETFTIEGVKENIANLPKIKPTEKAIELPQVDIFDAEAERQLPKGSPTEKSVYAKVLRDNDEKIKTFEASKVAAQMPTDDFEATINKKDLSFGNTQRASLMKAKLGGDMTAIESSLNEYQETPEFKRDVIKAANGNKAKFKEAAQLVLDNKANEYAFAPTKLQKKMQQFSDWAATNDIPLDYAVTKTLGAGLKGLTDVGAFGAALIGGTARSMGQVLDSKEVTMLDNFAAANAKAQKMSSGYIPQVQSEKASGLTQGLSDVTSIVAAIGTPMSVVKPVSIFGKAKNLLSLGTRGESAIAKGLSAEAAITTSGANKTLLEAAKVLQSKPANMVAQVLDGAATNWVIMGSSPFDAQRQKYLDMGFTEQQANRRAFGMTSLTNLLLAMPGVLRPHEASITQKIFSTGSKKETLKASLKQAVYFGGDMTLLRGIESTLDDNAKREQGIKIENTPFSELIKENGKKALVDAGAGFVMGLMARGKYKQSEMQLNGIVEAFKNPEQLSLDVQKDVANGRMTKEQAKTFQDFLTTIEPQYQKVLNETTEINGVQSPRFTPQTAVKIAIEKTKAQQAAEALKNLNASVETKTIYETDKKSGEIVKKTVYRHKDGKLYETEEASTKGRRISLLATKTNAEQRARRLEAGYNIENKLVAGWEMADLVDNNSLNGKAKEGQIEAIMANAPYEAVEINVNDFAKQPEIAELVSQIESGKLDVTNVEENNIAPPTIDAEGNVIDGKKVVAKAIVESAFERGGGTITFMKPITNEAYTEAANEAFESKVGDTAPITEGLPENEVIGVNAMSDAFDKVIENGGDAAQGLVEAAKEGLQTFVEPQEVAKRLKDIKGEDTFSEPIIEAAVNKAVKAEPIEAETTKTDIEKENISLVPIEKPNPSFKQNRHKILKNNEEVGFIVTSDPKEGVVKILGVTVNEGKRGQGIAGDAYIKLNKLLAKSGAVLESDNFIDSMEPQAIRIWEKLLSQGLVEKLENTYRFNDAELKALEQPTSTNQSEIEATTPTEAKTVAQLRAEEKAEMAATDPNDKEALDEIYNRYDKLITPLLEKEKAAAREKGVKDMSVAEKMRQKAAQAKEVEVEEVVSKKDSEQVYTTKNGKYRVLVDKGQLKVLDKNDKEINPSTAQKYLSEYKDSKVYDNEKDVNELTENVTDETSYYDAIEKSENPAQVAAELDLVPKYIPENELDFIESGIAQLINKVSREHYGRYGDLNNIGMSKAKAYLRKDGREIDTLAQEVESFLYGDWNAERPRVTEEDIIAFIDKYPNGSQEFYRQKNPIFTKLYDRLEKLLDYTPTAKDITNAAKQYNERLQGNEALQVPVSAESDFAKYLAEENSYEIPESELERQAQLEKDFEKTLVEPIEEPQSKLEKASSFIRDAAAKLREQHEREINDPTTPQQFGGLSKNQIAFALEKIADIIDAVGDVEKAIKQFLDGIKDPKERTEYEKEINNFFLEEYGEKEEVKPVPFAEIPKARLDEVMIEGEGKVDKTFANRVIASKAEEAAKVAVANQGLERVVDNFAIAEINANNLVEKYGYDIALSKAIEGEIDGAARSAILGMEYLRRDDAVRVANTATELRKATEDLAEWVSYIGYLQAKGGSANAYWGKFYADNPNLGLTLKDKIDKWAATAGKATPIDIREKYEKIDAELKTALERVKELEAQKPSDEMMKAIKAIQEQEAKKLSKPNLTKEQRNRTSDKLMALAEKIRKSENSGLVLSTPIPPHIISDSVKLLAQGVKVGEAIGDTMAKIYKLIEGGIKKKLTEEEKKKVSDYFTSQLEENVETDSQTGNPITNSLIRDYVLQGFNTPEALLEKLMEHYPNKSEREVRDMVSKYGQEITKTADEIDREIRLIKNVFKTKSQLEDIAQGIRPKKRILPVILTPAEKAAEEIRKAKERKMVKDVRQALDNMEVDLPTLDNELRNKLDKQEATLSNKIKDLELALESGKEITKNEKTKLTSEEIEKLELQLEDTRKIYNEVFGKKPMTEGERKLKSLQTELENLYKEKEKEEVEKAEPKYTTSEKMDIEALQNEIAARKKALKLEGSEIQTAEEKRIEALEKQLDNLKFGERKPSKEKIARTERELLLLDEIAKEKELQGLTKGKATEKDLLETKLIAKEKQIQKLRDKRDGIETIEPEKQKTFNAEIDKLDAEAQELRKQIREQKPKEQKVPYSLEAVDSAIDANNFKLKGAQADLEVVRKRGQDTSKIEADIERYKNNAKTLEGLKTEIESIEAKRVLQTFKNLAKRKEYYEQRKASGQYAKKPKNVLPETTELTKARSEVDRLKFEEQKLLYLAEKQSMSGAAKVGELVGGLWNVPRLALATGEWSFVGMQGRRLAASYLIKNPSVLKDAFQNAAKSWLSGEFAQEMESRIKNDPEYHIIKGSGLDLTEQSFKTAANEEIAYNNIGKIFWRFLASPFVVAEKMYKLKTGKDLGFIEKIDKFNPLVKFERSASGFLNTLRYAAMSDMIAVFKQEGLPFEKNKQDYKSAANYINTATGRGGSGIEAFQKNAEILSKFFFSPKMFMTELQLGTNPLGLAYIASMKDPSNIAKREAFKHQLRYMSVLLSAGLTATIIAYIKMGRTDENDDGTGVEFNPASTNYGKIVFPNGRTVDFFNGAQRYVVLYDRLFRQEKFKNREGVIKDVGVKGSPSKYDIIMNIPKNKLNPALGFFTGALDAQSRKLVGTEKYDDFGQVWDTEEEAKKLASPIFFQMVNNAYEQDPTILDGIGLFGAFFGKGFNVEEKKAPKPPKVRKRKSNYGFRYNP
jgi:hypothetical protein